jgi:hypothetical protein
MRPSLLFVITEDPRRSARPAEAIRIAAGVGTWQKADVRVYLRGAAVWALSEFTDELVDEDNYTRYLPIVREWGHPVYVQGKAPSLGEIGEATLAYEQIDDSQLAALAARTTCVLRF